jgi:hypothetical protein
MIRLREEMQTEKPTIHANVRNCSKDAHYIRGIFFDTGCIMKNLWCYNFLIFYPILTNDTSHKIVLETL